VTYDPDEQLIPPLALEREPGILTEDDYQRLLAACAHHPRDHAIIVLYLQTGMRLLELVRLRVTVIEPPRQRRPRVRHCKSMRYNAPQGPHMVLALSFEPMACDSSARL
jgi:integrase